jgi:hypothetical protein
MIPVSNTVTITTEISPLSAPAKAFNIGLIIGQSEEQLERVKIYGSLEEMDVLKGTAEYAAATLYFAQSPAPTKVAIGQQFVPESKLEALTACRQGNIDWYAFCFTEPPEDDVYDASEAEARIWYFNEEPLTELTPIAAGSACGCLLNMPGSRVVGIWQNDGESVAYFGIGFEDVPGHITTEVEFANSQDGWEHHFYDMSDYTFLASDWHDSFVNLNEDLSLVPFTAISYGLGGMSEIAAYVEAVSQPTAWFNTISGSFRKAVDGMTELKQASYKRALSIYTSEGENIAAALMGYAMGANTDTYPAYTLAYKQLVGVQPEDMDLAEFREVIGANGNIYITQGSYYNVFRQGKMANGFAFDDVLYLDMLENKISAAVMDLLTTVAKVPQTEDGIINLMAALIQPCEEMVLKGYIAPGIWNGRKVRSLEPGDPLNTGYKIMADSIAEQSQADRDARIAPPIYVCVKTAGAIEYVTIGLVVNR